MAITMRVQTVSFNGLNITPVTNTAEVTMGGKVAIEGLTDEAGRHFTTFEQKMGKVKFAIPMSSTFNPNDFKGVTDDLQVIADVGPSFLMTNAACSNDFNLKSGGNQVELEFIGDAIITI